MDEIWKDIPGFETLYQVSNKGRVRSLDRTVKHSRGGDRISRGFVMAPTKTKFGYLQIRINKGGNTTRYGIHRLVLSTFDKPMPREFDCCHIDSNRTNNCLENLRWDTRAGNMRDAVNLGRTNKGSKCPQSKLTDEQIVQIRSDTRYQYVIARDYGVNQATISKIKTSRLWSHI